METTTTPSDHKENKDLKSKVLLYGITALALGGAAYGAYTLYEHYVKAGAEKQVMTNPAVQQAETLRAALFRSGLDWGLHFGTANKDAVFAIASEITDFSAVETEYKNLYNADLQDDLREKLGADDLQKFLNTLNYNPNTVENKTKTKGGKTSKIGLGKALIVTIAKANLRKTPQDISHWSFHSNIIKLAEQGVFLGGSTGKTAYDNNGASNTGTLYLEIKSISMDTRKPIFFWVAASQVKAMAKAEFDSTNPPLMRLNEKETLSGMENSRLVIAEYNTPVMDANFKLVAIASPMQALGNEIMQLNDKKGNEYVKFLSQQQNEYWVNKKFIKII